jgi:hypothetical protein
MITAARSRQMRFTLIIQNFAQLNEVYGEQNAETIKGNCGNLVYLISTELKALEEISKMCGEVKSKKDDKTVSTPLITISDLQKLSLFEVIIRRVRLAPFKTKLTPNFQINWGKNYPNTNINDVPERERREVAVFDVRKFVDEKVKKNKDNLLDFGGPSAGLPFFQNMPSSNPFMSPFDMPNKSDRPLPKPPINEPDFDVDDIVKKIDAKIAQLEKEEAENKKALENNNEMDLNQIINSPESQKENNNNLEQIINNKPISEGNKPQDNPTDDKNDDFFDDFFDE